MRKALWTLACLLLVAGCGGGGAAVDYYANESTEAMDNWPESPLTYNQGLDRFVFHDDGLELRFDLDEAQGFAMETTLVNNTDQPVTIDWNEVYYVDGGGHRHHVKHDQAAWWSPAQDQVPTQVAPGATATDLIQPAQWVDQDGAARLAPLSDTQRAADYWAREVWLLMTLRIDGQTRLHRFRLEVDQYPGDPASPWNY